MIHTSNLNLTPKDVSRLASADAVAGFLTSLGYDTSARKLLTPEAIGLTGESAAAIRSIELMSEDSEGFLRVVFVLVRSLTAKCRFDLARVLGRANIDHLLVLTSDFGTLEFVLLDKRRRDARGPGGVQRIQVVPLVVAMPRKDPNTRELRTLRGFTWTGRDGLEQFDKLRTVFEAAAFSEDYFCNRALFADHYLLTRLRDDPAWADNPTQAFHAVKRLLTDARQHWLGKGEQIVRDELFGPLFTLLGFKAQPNKAQTNQTATDDQPKPDYLLGDSTGGRLTAAFVYAWDRWLDGPDHHLDQHTPDDNPGASVVTALEQGVADWIIVTNGRQWRLYSRQAHSRATNFYEVDLPEALIASGDTDPNEAFRYWWLFFRSQAFVPTGRLTPAARLGASGGRQPPGDTVTTLIAGCWLDAIANGSRDYAKQLGERLKERVFLTIFPHLAQGFLEDRRLRLGVKRRPTDDELRDAFEATLTLLYRLLFLLYAEARDLLPIREAAYREASLRKVKEEIAEVAGVAESEVGERIAKRFAVDETRFYDRLQRLFAAMDRGNAAWNVPTYNGGLFMTDVASGGRSEGTGDRLQVTGKTDSREQSIAQFLLEHKVPDRQLALAIDHLARDPDDKTFKLAFIDYKSLEVRHLGSIYEGLLEFKLRVADEDLATQADKKGEKYIPLSQAKPKRGRLAEVVVGKGQVYLSNDKAERKASGSYYTPDPIVEYIVEQTVGPVLGEWLESLRGEFRKVRKAFDNELQKATAYPVKKPDGATWDSRELASEKTYTSHKNLVEKLFEFRALDPAMGSGHFLVEAVDFITDKLLTFLNQFPINPVVFMLDKTRRNILEALGEQGVTVDPNKLTDINLLKRHVLKRCIYGVDLNPMAVELAKVSLWLDAFTLGAPLSFLDHHLRCGNSLVGATFADLRAATASRPLLRINYQPLTEALRAVVDTSRRADATSAEVKASSRDYGSARERLSGYAIVLDLLVAGYFGLREAPAMIVEGDSIDLDNRASFLGSLHGEKERSLVERVEDLATQPLFRFFHWDIEFPEVFFGFADVNERHLKHKNELSEGSAGFDVVVGNPPYVRMELIKPLKPFLKPHYRCHTERADLFIYFYERAIGLLRHGGRTAFIASSTWTKTKAGEGLRGYLSSAATVESFLDFGDSPVFPDATTYPCVMVVRREIPSASHEVVAAVVSDLEGDRLTKLLLQRGVHVPQRELEPGGWHLEDRRITRLREKILAAGVPLKEYCGSPLYGIKTGLNEAFVVNALTCERLVAEDRKSKEILKPLLEGKDLKPWRQEWRGLWLIYTHHGINIDHFPAIKAYLSTFRRRLEDRATSEHHAWYELQQPQLAYSARYGEPKILYPHFSRFPKFSVDKKGFYGNDKTYCIPGVDFHLLGVLNSSSVWFQISQVCPAMRGGLWRYELRVQYMDTLAIVQARPNDKNAVGGLAEQLSCDECPNRMALQAELDDRVAALYGLTAEERQVIMHKGQAESALSPEEDD